MTRSSDGDNPAKADSKAVNPISSRMDNPNKSSEVLA
jgi:hypothetical protein